MIGKIYKKRFDKFEIDKKNKIWEALCAYFFQKYINKDASVLDIGCGYGEFINNIKCREKYAIDLNKECRDFLDSDIKFFNCCGSDLSFLKDESIDAVFMSNFLEHLKNKDEIIKTFLEIKRVLKQGGRVLILGPNIKYAYKVYWDFFDHYLPLSDKALNEALEIVGFTVEKTIPKFLPYTTKSRIPQYIFFVKMYLRMPLIWKIMGRQMFIVAKK